MHSLRTGIRKTFTGHYLRSYTRSLGRRSLPGLGTLDALRFRVPTGEMLVVAERKPSPRQRDSR